MKFPVHPVWPAIGMLFLLSACGQKGKLVIPVPPPPISTPYPAATPKAVVPEPIAPADERAPESKN